MPRYKLIVEYDGTPFAGWQIQTNGLSVQQVVEEAIGRFSSEIVRIHCAGRTDSGVHATHQVIHVDLAKEWPVDTVRNATNAYLKRVPVSVLQVQMVPAVSTRGCRRSSGITCTGSSIAGRRPRWMQTVFGTSAGTR